MAIEKKNVETMDLVRLINNYTYILSIYIE